MPRKILIRSPSLPYHVTNRSNNKEFFYLNMDQLWGIFVERLNELKVQFQCEIHAFVLMSNHYHLLISTPQCNLGEAMKYLHREVAREANKQADRINHFFGGRYSWSLIDNEHYFWNSMKYLFRNPIRSGLCMDVSGYKYSSLNRNNEGLTWDISDYFHKKDTAVELDLAWLNEPFLNEQENAIKRGLRRREFQLPRSKCGRPINLDPARYKKGTVT